MKKIIVSLVPVFVLLVFFITACSQATLSPTQPAVETISPTQTVVEEISPTKPAVEETSPAPEATAPETVSEPVTLRVAFPADPKSFNGILSYWTMTSQINVQMFNRLLTYDKDYNLIGDLAESWEASADGKTYTFHLIPNVKWHDGQPFSSQDVKFHFEKVIEFGSSPTAVYFKKLDSIETPDDTTVIFHFSSTVSPHIFARLHADTFILPKHIYETGDFETNPANLKPIGTGPFKFVEYVQDSHVILEANPEYFKQPPSIDRLVFRIIPDASAALIALEGGEVDVIDEALGIPPSELGRLRNNPDLDVDTWPYYTVFRLEFNNRPDAIAKHPWLADRNVRLAIAYAIDRDFILQAVLNGVTTSNDTPISNTEKWVYNPDTFKVTYDKAKAEQLLDEAGYPRLANGIRFSFEFPVHIFGGTELAAEAMTQMLREVGIEMKVIPIEITAYVNEYMKGVDGLRDYAMTVGSGATGPDPVEVRSPLLFETDSS